MPTYYVEDYDGPRDDEQAETKVVETSTVEDKAVKRADSKRTARKKS